MKLFALSGYQSAEYQCRNPEQNASNQIHNLATIIDDLVRPINFENADLVVPLRMTVKDAPGILTALDCKEFYNENGVFQTTLGEEIDQETINGELQTLQQDLEKITAVTRQALDSIAGKRIWPEGKMLSHMEVVSVYPLLEAIEVATKQIQKRIEQKRNS